MGAEFNKGGFMDFSLPKDLLEFIELAELNKIIEKELRPFVLKLDEAKEYPSNFINKLRAALMGIWIPEKYGGAGHGVLGLAFVMEAIAKVCTGASTAYAANALCALPILFSGTEEQKKKYLAKIAAGEYLGAFCLTEPESGSDAFAMKAKAVKDGDCYILNGEKQFITNAGHADVYVVFAKTNPAKGARGISGFIAEKDFPGLSFSEKWGKMGLHCSETRNVIFSDCRVPENNLLGGKEGIGVFTIFNTLIRSRILVGAQGVGGANGAFGAAVDYAKKRTQFGQNIVNFQAIQHKLAGMARKIETARLMVYKAAWIADQSGKKRKSVKAQEQKDDIAKCGAMAKYYGADVAAEVTLDAIKIFGGTGYMRESGVEKFHRDAIALMLYEGTQEMQLNEIAQILIKESAK